MRGVGWREMEGGREGKGGREGGRESKKEGEDKTPALPVCPILRCSPLV